MPLVFWQPLGNGADSSIVKPKLWDHCANLSTEGIMSSCFPGNFWVFRPLLHLPTVVKWVRRNISLNTCLVPRLEFLFIDMRRALKLPSPSLVWDTNFHKKNIVRSCVLRSNTVYYKSANWMQSSNQLLKCFPPRVGTILEHDWERYEWSSIWSIENGFWALPQLGILFTKPSCLNLNLRFQYLYSISSPVNSTS
jgi:hypothetical protein